MSIKNWEHFFKPEVRSSGRSFIEKGQVALMRPSDTEARAYIRTFSPVKVSFVTTSIDSPSVTASCTCPVGKKGQLCKHMWAALVTIEDQNPDFFDSKTELESNSTTISDPQRPSLSQARLDSQVAYSKKQADYRKAQYQINKQRLKNLKDSKKSKNQEMLALPKEVQEALQYFSENNIFLNDCLDTKSINLARKKLAFTFHPDYGGSPADFIELNKHTKTLLKFSDN